MHVPRSGVDGGREGAKGRAVTTYDARQDRMTSSWKKSDAWHHFLENSVRRRIARHRGQLCVLWRGNSHNIPTARLGFIQALVRNFEQLVAGRTMLRKSGYACRKCQRPKNLLLILQSQVLYL